MVNTHHEIERTLHVQTSAAGAFPLFGPLGEREWAEGWDPRVIWSDGEGDREGMIFRNGSTEPVWVALRFDAHDRIAEYVHFTPDLITRIRVEVMPRDADSSNVRVRYAWTAITEAGEGKVAERRESFAEALQEWEPAINAALAKRVHAS